MDAGMRPQFAGVYKLEGHDVSKPTDEDEVQGILRNYLRNKNFLGKLGSAEEFHYEGDTYYAADDDKGDHYSQIKKLHEDHPLAHAKIGCWGKPDEKLARRQVADREAVLAGEKALIKDNLVGKLRVEYDFKDGPGNPVDYLTIHSIDVQA